MNLAGIPPFSGFLGKVGLLEAGVADGSPLALHAGRRRRASTSLLTLYAVARVWNRAFWRPPAQEPLADTAAAAASDAGAEVREPVPVGAGDTEDARAGPRSAGGPERGLAAARGGGHRGHRPTRRPGRRRCGPCARCPA